MSFFQNPSAYIQYAENDVIKFLATVKADVAIAEQDIINAFTFIQPYISTLGTGVVGAMATAAALGIGVPAPIITAATIITQVASTVNAAVAAQQASSAAGQSSGQQTVALLNTAYQQAKQAQAHLATGQAQLATPAAATPST